MHVKMLVHLKPQHECLLLLGHLSGCIVLHHPTFPNIWGYGERCFAKERMTITRDNSVGKTDA